MATILPDGTVLPSHFGLRSSGVAEDIGHQTNLALRMGEVKDIVYPENLRSQSRRFVEYTVEVQHQDGHGGGAATMYLGCMVSNLFGGAADLFSYTLRKDDLKETGPDGLGRGSKVLLLCVNGMTSRAMIIAGLRDTKTDEETIDSVADGHNLRFEFNGVGFSINKDGEAKLEFRGATNADGSLVEGTEALPTTIEVHKTGNLEVYTKNHAQSLFFDRKNDKIVINANSVEIGEATDSLLLGSTYRTAEQQLHEDLVSGLTQLSTQLGIASGAIAASATVVPTLAPAGNALALCAGQAGYMAEKITKFEAQAETFLSKTTTSS